jgi:hypothetical protein
VRKLLADKVEEAVITSPGICEALKDLALCIAGITLKTEKTPNIFAVN